MDEGDSQSEQESPEVTETECTKSEIDMMQLTITPEMVKQFIAEAEDLLAATEEAFLILDKDIVFPLEQ